MKLNWTKALITMQTMAAPLSGWRTLVEALSEPINILHEKEDFC